ncbi:hypothetical protein HK102_005000 [Quaeritorhiza haematococci]|nr:hypothetical protein HK102_005000 [Quaeritorhiza haematococci]
MLQYQHHQVSQQRSRLTYIVKEDYSNCKHTAGINALALDLTTPTEFDGRPGGILYTGGRDSVINSWDLHLEFAKHEQPTPPPQDHTQHQKPASTSFSISSDTQDPDFRILARKESEDNGSGTKARKCEDTVGLRQSREGVGEIHAKNSGDWVNKTGVPTTKHRRTFQHHSDWVNDMVLCNNNQQLISCSSDRSVYIWSTNPTAHRADYHATGCSSSHPSARSDRAPVPHRIGYHRDYIKCLALPSFSSHPGLGGTNGGVGWVASGGLDHAIRVWDLVESKGEIVCMEDRSSPCSIYSLACNAPGTTLVSGSPDKIVKVWDPRSGEPVLRLRGHTDNIRSLLVISASSDTTIKLWSLASPQRCVVTYTHNEAPVWCLASNDADLSTFFAGAKDGWVTKMSRRRLTTNDSHTLSTTSTRQLHPHSSSGSGGYWHGLGETSAGLAGVEGPGGSHMAFAAIGSRFEDEEHVDCLAICREDQPIVKLVTIDDMYIWTATTSSSVRRWRDIPLCKSTMLLPHADGHALLDDEVELPFLLPDSVNVTIPTEQAARARQLSTPFSPTNTSGLYAEKRVEWIETIEPTPGKAHGSNVTGLNEIAISKDEAKSNFNNEQCTYIIPTASIIRQITSVVSVDESHMKKEDSEEDSEWQPVCKEPDDVIEGSAGITRYVLLNNRRHVITLDADGEAALWDIVRCVQLKSFGRLPAWCPSMPPSQSSFNATGGSGSQFDHMDVEFKPSVICSVSGKAMGTEYPVDERAWDRLINAQNSTEWIGNWCTIDVKNGVLMVHLDEGKCYDAEIYHEESESSIKPLNEDQRSDGNQQDQKRQHKEESQGQLPSQYRQHGDEQDPHAATVQLLGYYRQSQAEPSSTNSDKNGTSADAFRDTSPPKQHPHKVPIDPLSQTRSFRQRSFSSPVTLVGARSVAPDDSSPASLHHSRTEPGAAEQSVGFVGNNESGAVLASDGKGDDSKHAAGVGRYFERVSADGAWTAASTPEGRSPYPGLSVSHSALTDDSKPVDKLSRQPLELSSDESSPQGRGGGSGTSMSSLASSALTQPSSFMNKIKTHMRRKTTDGGSRGKLDDDRGRSVIPASDANRTHGNRGGVDKGGKLKPKSSSWGSRRSKKEKDMGMGTETKDKDDTSNDRGFGGPSDIPSKKGEPIYQLPPGNPNLGDFDDFVAELPFVNYQDAPPIRLPPDVPLIISYGDITDASNYIDQYRGTVKTVGDSQELARINRVIPQWILEWIVENRNPAKDPVKLSFMLVPAPGTEAEILRELPNGNNRLSANRMLRVKKLLAYVVEKLELDPPSNFSPQDTDIQPDMWLELVCLDKVSVVCSFKVRVDD